MSFMETEVLKIDDTSLARARELILGGELCAFPTETVYGLGALAYSDEDVEKIFEAKGRPSDNPLIVHVHKDYDVDKLVTVEYDYVYRLREAFLPGPLTMVYKSKGMVSPVATCGLGTVGIRIPSHEGAQAFLKAVDVPVAAPSANVSKHTSPVTARHVLEDLGGKIPLILDGGKCTGGIESTVLDVTTDTPVILRSGLVTADMIRKVAGKCRYSENKPTDEIRAPGMKYRHYCPKCETALFERKDFVRAQEYHDRAELQGRRVCFMCDEEMASLVRGKILSLGRTAEQIASNLYDKLHEAEEVADLVVAFAVDTGSDVDVGIMNRLSKACKKAADERE